MIIDWNIRLAVFVGEDKAGLVSIFVGDCGLHLLCKRGCRHWGRNDLTTLGRFGLGPLALIVWDKPYKKFEPQAEES